jgi:hypothetical protein
MTSLRFGSVFTIFALLTTVTTVQAQDLHIKKNISVNGNWVSSSDTSIKGARERTVTGSAVTVRQCDLKRTLTLNEEAQTFLVTDDPQDDSASRATALATGVETSDPLGAITVTTTITDTGERKTMYGYNARHLKATISEESSPNACSQVREKYELDGWYADLSKEQAGCAHFVPPVHQAANCHDPVVARRIGSGKPGYPLAETITMHNSDTSTTSVSVHVSEMSKQQDLPAELFDVPSGYHQVNSVAALNGIQGMQQVAATSPTQATGQRTSPGMSPLAQMMNPATSASGQMAQQRAFMAQAQQMGMGGGMAGMSGGAVNGSAVAAPQQLGPKAPGRIRVGVAPPDAQLGQGSNAAQDYSTPIRNTIILLMNGPAVEIAALDSRIPMQVQVEAQQKQCDYILYSSVTVKHGSSSGFGKFMKMAAPMASMVPMVGMAGGIGGALAAQTAGAAASAAAQAAQQQAMNQAMSQLSGFNGQIKSKDDVSVVYQLVPAGQDKPKLENSLKAKAKTDGEDVLTPLIQQTASTVLAAVSAPAR